MSPSVFTIFEKLQRWEESHEVYLGTEDVTWQMTVGDVVSQSLTSRSAIPANVDTACK